MKPKIWNSLAFKLISSMAFFSLLLVAALAYLNTQIVEESYKTQLKERVSQSVKNVLPQIRRAIHDDDDATVQKLLQKLKSFEEIETVELNRVGSESFSEPNSHLEQSLFHLSFPVKSDIDGSVKGMLDIGISPTELRAKMTYYFQFLGVIIVGYLLLIFVLMRLVYRALIPLQELTHQLEAFDPGHPIPIELESVGSSEIAMIAAAANKMSDNIMHHADFMNELNKEIEEGRQHLKEAQQIARMGSWRVDPESYTCEFSDQMYVLLGKETEDSTVNWKTFVEAIDERDRQTFLRAVENTAKSHVPFRLLHKMLNAHGEMMHVLTEGKLSHRQDGAIIVSGITMDVSEQTESQRTIEKLAFYDPLTNLPNRLLLNDRLQKAIKSARRRGEKVGVLFLDLDRFKNINDTLGHTLGDRLLKEVAMRLRKTLRASDTISRIGGDEFIVVLPDIQNGKEALVVARKLIEKLEESLEFEGRSLFVTASIGIALFPDHANDTEALIQAADTAMYEAKEAGRNRSLLYDVKMGLSIAKKLEIEQEMREAIETMDQFELYFQPKISLRSGAIVGAEALIRWNHPSLGLVFPDDFIPIAENTGMIIQIGEWVIQEAARRVQQWQKAGIAPLKLAVNLSGRQFTSPSLLYQIADALNRYEIKPQFLEFEVTESIAMISLQESLKVLHQLRDLGVGVHIDDFGTGYSSLAYLKQFPVDTLKIDKAFIMNMLEDQDDRTIVETIVSMSKAMGLKIVAEGVETLEHVKMLKKMGVDFGQGYYFSKPIPFVQFDRLYRVNLVKMKERREAKKQEGLQ